MAEVSCGSRRSERVMAWVTEIEDQSGLKWVTARVTAWVAKIGDRSGLKWVVGMAKVGHEDRRLEIGVA